MLCDTASGSLSGVSCPVRVRLHLGQSLEPLTPVLLQPVSFPWTSVLAHLLLHPRTRQTRLSTSPGAGSGGPLTGSAAVMDLCQVLLVAGPAFVKVCR